MPTTSVLLVAALASGSAVFAAPTGRLFLGETAHPLLRWAGFEAIRVSPRVVDADAARA